MCAARLTTTDTHAGLYDRGMRHTLRTLFIGSLTALAACHDDPPVIDVDDEEPVIEEPEAVPDVELLIDVLMDASSVDVYVTDPTVDCVCDGRFPAMGGCVEYTDMPTCLCLEPGPISTAPCVTEVALVDKAGTAVRARGASPMGYTYVGFAHSSEEAPIYDVTDGGYSVRIRGCGPDKLVALPVETRAPPRVLGTVVESTNLAPVTHFYLDDHRPQLVHITYGLGGRVCRSTPSDTMHVWPHNFFAPYNEGQLAQVLDLHGPVELGLATARVWTKGFIVSGATALAPKDETHDLVPGGVLAVVLRSDDEPPVSLPIGEQEVTRARDSGAVTIRATLEALDDGVPAPTGVEAVISDEGDRLTLTYADGVFAADLHHEPRGEDALDRIEPYALWFVVDDLVLADVLDPSRTRAASLTLAFGMQNVLVSTLAVDDTAVPPLPED